MKKYRVLQNMNVYDMGTSSIPRFTLDPQKAEFSVATLEFRTTQVQIGLDRSEIGKWLIEQQLVKEE